MILRLLGARGIAGLAVAQALAVLLLVQKGETRHWRKQSGQYEQLYHGEHAAFAGTVATYRTAAEGARAADAANTRQVHAEQAQINERTADDYQARLADARVRAEQLRLHAQSAAADPGVRREARVPGLPASAGRAAQAAGEDRLSGADALVATEQAIQLDELIKWVRRQAAVPVNGDASGQR